MSTILKALQRLEQDKSVSRPVNVSPVLSGPQTTSGGMFGWLYAPWVRRAGVGVIVAGLCVAVFYFYQQSRKNERNPKFHKEVATNTARKPNATAELPPVQQRQAKPRMAQNQRLEQRQGAEYIPPVPQVPVESTDTFGSAGSFGSMGARADMPAAQEQPAVEMPVSRPLNNNGAASVPASPPTSAPVSKTPDNIGPAGPGPAPSAAKDSAASAPEASADTYENTPQLTDGRLKVHAIAWSRVAEDRMAVVNNRVVYEGDNVDDFVIVAIRQDDVVVREKQKGMWKVVFGKP